MIIIIMYDAMVMLNRKITKIFQTRFFHTKENNEFYMYIVGEYTWIL